MMESLRLMLPGWMAEALVEAAKQVLRREGIGENIEAGEAGGIEISVWQKGNERVGIATCEEGTVWKVEIDSQGLDVASLLTISAAEAAQMILTEVASFLPDKQKEELERMAKMVSNFISSQNLSS